MSTQPKDYYKVLGVSEDATPDAIRKAYRRLAKKYHPDVNAGDEKAAEQFKAVGEAYGVLSDDAKRQQYDQMRKYGGMGFGGASGPAGQSGGSFSFEDLGGFGDIFSTIFDRGGRAGTRTRSRPEGPTRGGDVEVPVEVSFETAVRGGKLNIKVPVSDPCTACGGRGAPTGVRRMPCQECSGTGSVSFGQGGFAVNRPCPACTGRGQVPERPCTTCLGRGKTRVTRQLEVTVPAGVETGARLKLAGQGERGMAGAPSGDLFLQFQVRPHNFFRRDGLDLLVTLPINVAQATLGSKVRVRTLGGDPAVLTIPPGTQSGSRFRLSGHGVRKGERTGDQIVEVTVETPTDLSDEAKEAMKRFAKVSELRY